LLPLPGLPGSARSCQRTWFSSVHIVSRSRKSNVSDQGASGLPVLVTLLGLLPLLWLPAAVPPLLLPLPLAAPLLPDCPAEPAAEAAATIRGLRLQLARGG